MLNPKSQIPNPKFIIVVARDSTVKRLKGVLRNPEQVRKKVLEQAFPDALVVLGDEKDPMKVVRKYRPHLVCLGYDQKGFSDELMQQFPEIKIERIGAYRPEKYKSSKMKQSSRATRGEFLEGGVERSRNSLS